MVVVFIFAHRHFYVDDVGISVSDIAELPRTDVAIRLLGVLLPCTVFSIVRDHFFDLVLILLSMIVQHIVQHRELLGHAFSSIAYGHLIRSIGRAIRLLQRSSVQGAQLERELSRIQVAAFQMLGHLNRSCAIGFIGVLEGYTHIGLVVFAVPAQNIERARNMTIQVDLRILGIPIVCIGNKAFLSRNFVVLDGLHPDIRLLVIGNCLSYNLDQVFGLIVFGVRSSVHLVSLEIEGPLSCKRHVLENDVAVHVFDGLQFLPEAVHIDIINRLDAFKQLFHHEGILLLVVRRTAVDGLGEIEFAIEADQRAAVVGIQMALTGGLDVVADHAAAVVAALYVDQRLGRNHMAELGGNVGGQIDIRSVREVPQQGHARTVLHRRQRLAVQQYLRRDIGAAAGIGDYRRREHVGIRNVVALFVLGNHVNGNDGILGIIDDGVRAGRHLIDVVRLLGYDISPARFRQGIRGACHHTLQAIPIHVGIGIGDRIPGRAGVSAQRTVRPLLGTAGLRAVDDIADNGIHFADIAVPGVVVVLAVVDERLAIGGHIAANDGRLGDEFAVRHAGAGLMDDIAADEHAAHAVVLHQEVTGAESAFAALAGAGGGIRAQRDDVIAVQDILQAVTVELVVVDVQRDHIVDIRGGDIHSVLVYGSARLLKVIHARGKGGILGDPGVVDIAASFEHRVGIPVVQARRAAGNADQLHAHGAFVSGVFPVIIRLAIIDPGPGVHRHIDVDIAVARLLYRVRRNLGKAIGFARALVGERHLDPQVIGQTDVCRLLGFKLQADVIVLLRVLLQLDDVALPIF